MNNKKIYRLISGEGENGTWERVETTSQGVKQMNENNDTEYVSIGVRVPRSLYASLQEHCYRYDLTRSSFIRLLLSWFGSGPARLSRVKFARFLRDYKSFQRI